MTALALDLQQRGATFLAQVRRECRERGVGRLLVLSSTTPELPPDIDTFTGVVDQVCRVWRNAALSDAARTGRHLVFLSGSVAIALVLGARLTAQDASRWTAATYDQPSGRYEFMAAA